ncbi:MAG: hypothetical protein ACO2Z9_05665 [Crocinitomicaceae bacterium]
MNKLLTSIFCGFCLSGLSQETIIIDRDNSNRPIFDYDDPFSLVSLLKFNWIEEINGMDSPTIEYLTKKKLIDSVYFFDGEQITTPLIEEDPKSPGFGEPVTVVDSETGMETFVYPAPERTYYDVDDISRILIIKDTVRNFITGEKYYGIKEVGFAKKYESDKKYTVTMRIPFEYLMRMDAFKALVKLPEEVKKELSDKSNERSLFNQVKKDRYERRSRRIMYQRDTAAKNPIDLNYSLPDYRIMQNGFTRFRRSKNLAGIQSEMYRTNSLAFKHSFDVPFTSSDPKILYSHFEVLDTVFYGRSPLIDEDPNSPTFGEPLTKENENGQLSFVYPKEEYTYHVEFEPESAYLLMDFYYIDGKRSRNFGIVPEHLIFTGDAGDKEHLIFTVYMYDENLDKWGKRIDMEAYNDFVKSIPTYDQLEWRRILLNQASNNNALMRQGSKEWQKQFN